jgi:hypothetical protein
LRFNWLFKRDTLRRMLHRGRHTFGWSSAKGAFPRAFSSLFDWCNTPNTLSIVFYLGKT